MTKARVQHQVRTAAHLRQDLVLQRGVARQAGRRVSADTGNEGRVVGDVSQCSTVLTYLIVCVQPAIHKQA